MERIVHNKSEGECYMNSIETLVHVEVADRLNEMSGWKTTSDEYKATADTTLKFIDRATKMAEVEVQFKANELKEKELEESRKKRKWDFAKEALKVSGALVGAFLLTAYERSESITSTSVKELWKQITRIK